MSKSLKQEQDDLFAGLEDILPTKKELSWETRSANPIWHENIKKGREKLKDDPEHQARMKAAGQKKSNDPEFLKNLKNRINQRFMKQNGVIYTPYGIFKTLTEGADVLKIDGRTLAKRIKEKADYLYIPFDFDISQIDKLIKEKKEILESKIKPKKGVLYHKGMAKQLTTPFGVFVTLGECYSFIKENKLMIDPARKIPKLLKIENSGYKYISKEEYIMLTGKDI
jgi:hypothetical protein